MTAAAPSARRSPAELAGWNDDDHQSALSAYLKTAAPDAPRPMSGQSAAAFFSSAFTIGDPGQGLMTAYFEPELRGSLTQTGPYQHPLYSLPLVIPGQRRYLDRAAIDDGALKGKGLELVWLDDPVDAFFLHIQGSGRIRLPNGKVLRVAYAGKNGHPYQSIGRILVDRGVMRLEEVTAEGLKTWLRADPTAGTALMRENASYVFFAERPGLTPEDGPIGTAQVPLTAKKSIAVDAGHHPLGSLLWLRAEDVTEARGVLVVAQDTGGAIKGAHRIDLFLGAGLDAGRRAGEICAEVQVTPLIPQTVDRM